jgi:hypothetical protein
MKKIAVNQENGRSYGAVLGEGCHQDKVLSEIVRQPVVVLIVKEEEGIRVYPLHRFSVEGPKRV